MWKARAASTGALGHSCSQGGSTNKTRGQTAKLERFEAVVDKSLIDSTFQFVIAHLLATARPLLGGVAVASPSQGLSLATVYPKSPPVALSPSVK